MAIARSTVVLSQQALITGASAGIMLLGPAESAPVEEWERMLAINVQGLLYTTHAAPHTC